MKNEIKEVKKVETEVSSEKAYPSAPDENGYYFSSEEDEALKITTKDYPNGGKTKTVMLPVCKKLAVVRSIKAKEAKDITRIMGKDPELYQMSVITVSTTLDGKKTIIEEVQDLMFKDYQLLVAMNSDLNF